MKKSNWIVVEQAEFTHYLFAAAVIRGMTTSMQSLGLPNFKESGTEYIKEGGNYVANRAEWKNLAKRYLKIVVKNPNLLHKINLDNFKYSAKLFTFGKRLIKINYTKLSNVKLAWLFNEFERLHLEAHMRRVPMWVKENSGEVFSNYIINELQKVIKRKKLSLNAGAVFATLVTPLCNKTHAAQEKINFIKLALQIKQQNKQTDNDFLKQILHQHAARYCWLPYGISGPAWDINYFINAMKELLEQSSEELKTSLIILKAGYKNTAREQERLLTKLKLNKNLRRLIKLAQESIVAKAYSKEALFFGYYAAETMLNEIARRLGINLRLVRRMFPWEVEPALLTQRVNRAHLAKRYEHSFHYIFKGKDALHVGAKANQFIKKINLVKTQNFSIAESSAIYGQCARPGRAKGRVKLVFTPKDMLKMKRGNILVSRMTDPQILSAMKKSSAIVTDIGGITCHAAIVSRELGIPCVIGTKIATQVLKDGDLVEVDAEKGIIKKIT